MRKNLLLKDKKGAGLVTTIIVGVAALVISVIVSLLVVTTLNGAGLLTANSVEANATTALIGNYTAGIDEVSEKIPTILLIAAVVILFGAIVILVQRSRQMTGSGGL